MSYINGLISAGLMMVAEMQANTDRLKQEAIDQFIESAKYPRKKKKKVRKVCNLKYSIACWGEDIIPKF